MAFAQKLKFNGVKIGVISVAIPVRPTERAVFAPEIDEMKFEIFPPGHAATKSIPSANAGCGFKSNTIRKVKKGSSKNWEITPVITPFGLSDIILKSVGLIPRAIPNMINPKQIFRRVKLSSENCMEIWWMGCERSKVGVIYPARLK